MVGFELIGGFCITAHNHSAHKICQTIGLAIRNTNVYLELSECEIQPLSNAYIEAANGLLPEKICRWALRNPW